MTACKECLLEAAELLVREYDSAGSPMADLLRHQARTAPSWAELNESGQLNRGLRLGDEVEVHMHDTWDWLRVRVMSFWRGGFDWSGNGVAGRVNWDEEGKFWRRPARLGPVGASESGTLVGAGALPGYERAVTLPLGIQLGDPGITALEREIAEFDRQHLGGAVLGTHIGEGGDFRVQCRDCPRLVRAHINGLCVECWRAAGRPEGKIQVVGEPGEGSGA